MATYRCGNKFCKTVWTSLIHAQEWCPMCWGIGKLVPNEMGDLHRNIKAPISEDEFLDFVVDLKKFNFVGDENEKAA